MTECGRVYTLYSLYPVKPTKSIAYEKNIHKIPENMLCYNEDVALELSGNRTRKEWLSMMEYIMKLVVNVLSRLISDWLIRQFSDHANKPNGK